MAKVWTAGLAVIGDEILSGRTQDRNIAQVAIWLNVQGIRLAEVRVVPDVEDLGRQPAGAAHSLEALRPVELNHMAARLGAVLWPDLDIFRHGP